MIPFDILRAIARARHKTDLTPCTEAQGHEDADWAEIFGFYLEREGFEVRRRRGMPLPCPAHDQRHSARGSH